MTPETKESLRPFVVEEQRNRSTIHPTFTTRHVKPPRAKGHREWLKI